MASCEARRRQASGQRNAYATVPERERRSAEFLLGLVSLEPSAHRLFRHHCSLLPDPGFASRVKKTSPSRALSPPRPRFARKGQAPRAVPVETASDREAINKRRSPKLVALRGAGIVQGSGPAGGRSALGIVRAYRIVEVIHSQLKLAELNHNKKSIFTYGFSDSVDTFFFIYFKYIPTSCAPECLPCVLLLCQRASTNTYKGENLRT